MKIKVKQKHIDAGKRWYTGNCPVALAIKEVYKTDVWVYSDSIRIADNSLEIPDAVKGFVNAFDSGKPVSPFEFELSLNK